MLMLQTSKLKTLRSTSQSTVTIFLLSELWVKFLLYHIHPFYTFSPTKKFRILMFLNVGLSPQFLFFSLETTVFSINTANLQKNSLFVICYNALTYFCCYWKPFFPQIPDISVALVGRREPKFNWMCEEIVQHM
jgi:hypothetical protein